MQADLCTPGTRVGGWHPMGGELAPEQCIDAAACVQAGNWL